MKFVFNFYVLVIILRSTRVVQNATDFTLDELTHISRELSPMECMRLLEAIYLAIPKENEHRVIAIRETPMSKWISKEECLNELKAWDDRFPDKTEPKARIVMILHLNSLGRTDLANYVRKKEDHDREKGKISKERIFRRDTSKNKPDHNPHTKRITHAIKRPKLSNRSGPSNDIHHSIISPISEGPVSNGLHSGPGKCQSSALKDAAVPRNSLYMIIALGIVVIFICGMVLLIFRRSLRTYPICLGERSDLCPGNNFMQEKGLQCIRCLNDQDDYETQSNLGSQISEIDVEGGSCFNSRVVDCRESFSEAVLCTERTTPGVSVEELKLFDEELDMEISREAPPSSCRCRPLQEKKICGAKPRKKKKKCKVKAKEETCRSAKSYLKSMQEKILPRQRRQSKKESNFDMKQFQEKILAILNKECGVCRCCNCTPHRDVDDPKMQRSTEIEEGCIQRDRKERKKKHLSNRDKNEKLSIPEGSDKGRLTGRTSLASRSPMSDRRSIRKQESDSVKKVKIQSKEKSGKSSSSGMKKSRDKRVLMSSASSSETDQSHSSNTDSQQLRISNSERSKKKGPSVNALPRAHENPKRFF